ncbi:hypothetical protein CRENBAI_016103 [Crenichthys baileyi]|uniref:Uncharacterized protein n=1 Tax=Crenichthys baileyi TaxID=28760 RepID=A0AAV9RA94_9TELE
MQANRSKPSTAHQLPRCSRKTRSAAPPTRPATAARRPNHGPEPQKQWKKATAAPVSGHPANPTPKPRECPSPPATRTPAWRTMAHQVVQPASPSIGVGPHPNQCRLSPPYRAQSQGPRSQGTQAIPRERAETPAPAPDSPQDLTPKPSPDPTRGPTPSPGLRPQMGNSERGCEKTPSLPPPAQMWC